jgi:NAD(P)-dependent dehydrogenase (short-subunit alcohol dehydrogenase family)
MRTKKINFDDLQWERSYGPWKAYCQSKLADLLFTLELGRRCTAAGIGLLSNAAHPGYARTNLQTSGPGGPLNPVEKIIPIEKIMASFMSQDAAHGALPTLRAATAMDSAQGSYYAPDRMFELKGDPVLVPVPKPARNEAVARRLWEVSLGLTGGSFAGL